MWQLTLLLLSLMVLSSCNQTPGDSVKIVSGNVTSTALFSVNNQPINDGVLNLGEYILNSAPINLTVRVYNDTQYPFTDIDLAISTANPEHAPTVNYVPSDEGGIGYPGNGGTCGRTLASKQACLITLIWSPREERPYLERLTLNFKDYIDQKNVFADLQVLAGTPASLTFTNDVTQYTFGNLIGTAQTPVVERADGTTYTEELEVKNVGGLFARNLTVTHLESCVSAETNACPTGMAGAYVLHNNCPNQLGPQESCRVTVVYRARNQDPASGPVPTDINEISYRDTVTFNYIKDPANGTGALNGYFRSVSTNIEARMRVALTKLSFDTPVITGNRDVRTFRVNNMGFREGEIKSFTFKNNLGAVVATCSANNGSDILQCLDLANNPTILANFPFFVKDRNSCMAAPPLTGTLIEVGSGCIFDLYFQPSNTFLTNQDFNDYQIEVNYDSRWRGGPKIMTNKILDLSAKSMAAARMELVRFNYLGTEYPITGINPAFVDMGRLALQSSTYFKRKVIIISFRNVGSIATTGTAFRDLLNKVIPIGGTPVTLGTRTPYYYTNVVANESNCAYIAPNDTCYVTMEFAPIGRTLGTEEDENMFDGVTLDGRNIKGITMSYISGANYSDTNFTDTPDISSVTLSSQIHAQLIRKGLLMQLADSSQNLATTGGQAAAGDTIISYLYIQNIGTGDVPYVRYFNAPNGINGLSIVPTSDPASLGADYDCLTIVDTDNTGTIPSSATPASRAGYFSSLPMGKICVYTIQARTPSRHKAWNAFNCTNSLGSASKLLEGQRAFSRQREAGNGGLDLWEYCSDYTAGMSANNINISYYDGDASDPALPVGSTYGRQFNLNSYGVNLTQSQSSKIVPYSFTPVLSATLYRPSFSYPYLSPTQPSGIIPERWFFGSEMQYFNDPNDPELTSPFIQAGVSRNFASTLSSFSDRGNFDHVLYLGSFPEGSPTFQVTPGLMSIGTKQSRFRSFDIQSDPAFTLLTPITVPFNVSNGSTVNNLNFDFNPSTPGEHRIEIRYEYENGRHTAPLIYRQSTTPVNYSSIPKVLQEGSLLVVAHVQAAGTHPYLALDVQDYEVTQNPGFAPTESPQTPYNVALSWNNLPAPSSLIFDSIKLTAAPTIQDVYAKKRLILRNPTAFTLRNLKTMFRPTIIASSNKILPTTFKIQSAGTTCIADMNLAPGASCSIVYTYQPGSSESTDNFFMSMSYDMGNGQPVMQNVGISLMPRSPGLLVAVGKATESMNYKVTSSSSTTTRFSYPLNFGTVTMNTVPRVMNFNTTSGTYQKLQFINTQTTKASLLLSYQRYITENSLRGYSPGTPAPTSLIPDAAEYHTISGSSLLYTPIMRTTYGNGTEKLLVEASKGCFFGDDELDGAIPAHQKGFNSATSTANGCYLTVKFSAAFSWLLTTINQANGDHMRDTAAELWYFSVNRSSTASVWIHVRGTVNPDTSVASGDYSDVESYDNRTLAFRVPDLAPTTSTVGDIVGLRVLMSTTASALNSPYSTSLTSYFDIRPYIMGAENYAEFLTGLANGQFFYFRVVAIRRDTRFTDSSSPRKFVGLNANEYLSNVTNNATPLKVLVPPMNHSYFHAQKLVIDKNLHDGVTYANFSAASAKCSGKARMALKDPGTINYQYQLITIAAWEILLGHPAATSYANMTQISHWVNNPQVSVDTMCSGLPGFLPGQASQVLTSSGTFYLRNSSNYSSLVNQAVGGVPGTPYSNYMSYVYGTTSFASSRCMVVLP